MGRNKWQISIFSLFLQYGDIIFGFKSNYSYNLLYNVNLMKYHFLFTFLQCVFADVYLQFTYFEPLATAATTVELKNTYNIRYFPLSYKTCNNKRKMFDVLRQIFLKSHIHGDITLAIWLTNL